jgi:hypothetical protein
MCCIVIMGPQPVGLPRWSLQICRRYQHRSLFSPMRLMMGPVQLWRPADCAASIHLAAQSRWIAVAIMTHSKARLSSTSRRPRYGFRWSAGPFTAIARNSRPGAAGKAEKAALKHSSRASEGYGRASAMLQKSAPEAAEGRGPERCFYWFEDSDVARLGEYCEDDVNPSVSSMPGAAAIAGEQILWQLVGRSNRGLCRSAAC